MMHKIWEAMAMSLNMSFFFGLFSPLFFSLAICTGKYVVENPILDMRCSFAITIPMCRHVRMHLGMMRPSLVSYLIRLHVVTCPSKTTQTYC